MPIGAAGFSSLAGLEPTAILSTETTNDRTRSPDASQAAHSGFCESCRIERAHEVVAGVELRHRAELVGTAAPFAAVADACTVWVADPGTNQLRP